MHLRSDLTHYISLIRNWASVVGTVVRRYRQVAYSDRILRDRNQRSLVGRLFDARPTRQEETGQGLTTQSLATDPNDRWTVFTGHRQQRVKISIQRA